MPGEVETLLVNVCADCGKPTPQAGGHIHKRFSPTQQIEVVRVSDLDAIRSQERQRVREGLLTALAPAQTGDFKIKLSAVRAALDSLEDSDG